MNAKLKIEYRPIDSVMPYAHNARKHSKKQVSKVARSILEFGMMPPILIDENGTIIAGHYCSMLGPCQETQHQSQGEKIHITSRLETEGQVYDLGLFLQSNNSTTGEARQSGNHAVAAEVALSSR